MKKLLFVIVIGIFNAYGQQPLNKVVYADTDYIMSLMPEMKQMEDKVKETQLQLQGEFNEKTQQLQKMYADYTANVKTMADSTRQKTELVMQQLNGELQQFQQNANTTLENTRKLYMAPVYLAVGRAINEVAKENGFSIILPLRIGGQAFLLHGDKKMDISELVLAKLGITQAPEEKNPSPDTKKPKQ